MLDRWAKAAVLTGLGIGLGIGAALAESPFDTDPHDKALIVIDAVVRHKTLLASRESPITSGALWVRTEGNHGARQPASQAIAGVLPFAVEPGRYRPAYVIARARRMQVGTGTVDLRIPLPTDSLPALVKDVEAGALVYVGLEILMVPRPFKENAYRFQVSEDPARERAAWERLLAKSGTGRWENAIRGRLAELSALGDSSGSPRVFPADSTH
jgi:hypothetical protein